MKNLFLLTVIGGFLTVSTAVAQNAGDILWTGLYGGSETEKAYCVQQTDDGSYIVAGYTNSFGIGNRDYYLIKMNTDGDTLWTRTYGGNDDEWGRSVQQTEDGGFIIGGYVGNIWDENYDFYLVKTDSNGDELWSRTYDCSDIDQAYCVQQTSDGGYIIGGRTGIYEFSKGYMYDVYLVKTDADGDTVWTSTFGESDVCEWIESVCQTDDGGFVATGICNYVNYETADVLLIKIDADGDSLWAHTYDSGEDNDRGYSIEQTTDGGLIIGGMIGGSAVYKGYLLKTDAEGNELWSRTYAYQWSSRNKIKSVRQTLDGGYIAAAHLVDFYGIYCECDAYFIKTDDMGNIIWETVYVDSFHQITMESIWQNDDGSYISCGTYIGSPQGPGGFDIFVVKLAGSLMGIESDPTPSQFALNGNCPNPFSSQTSICFNIPEAGHVDLEVYNVLGRKVETLVDDYMQAGSHNLNWDASSFPRGIYFCRLVAGDISETRRMMLIE